MGRSFVVQLVEETIYRTTAKLWNVNTRINLERSLLPTTRLGGHFVQGHVDTIIKINDIKKKDESAVWDFELTDNIKNYVIEKGSISLDGISLTIAKKFPIVEKDIEIAEDEIFKLSDLFGFNFQNVSNIHEPVLVI